VLALVQFAFIGFKF